jgi:hypothetical protein
MKWTNQRCREAKYEGKDNSVSTSKGPARSHSNMERTFFESGHYHPAIRQPGTADLHTPKSPTTTTTTTAATTTRAASHKTMTDGTSNQATASRVSHRKIYRFASDKIKFEHSIGFELRFRADASVPCRGKVRRVLLGLSGRGKEQNYYSQLTRSKSLIIGEAENCPHLYFQHD